jgi:hypothetical protein
VTVRARLLLPVFALGLHLLAATHPEVVETYYSRALYPRLAGSLAFVSARLPFAVAEPLLAGALVTLALLGFRRLRLLRGRSWTAAVVESASRVLSLAGALYLVFLGVWGLNYQRLTLAKTMGFAVQPADRRELAEVGAALATRADVLRAGLAEDAHGVLRLATGSHGVFGRTRTGFSEARSRFAVIEIPAAHPKPALFSPILSRLAISGIFSPFTAEPLVNAEVPDPDLPFCAAHEMAHAAGFAREDEANYLGSLACRLHADTDFRYSGTLAASLYVTSALAGVDRDAARRLHDGRSAAVKRDIEALEAWAARHEGPVAEASRRVNNAYLRSQGTRDGVASYGRFVDLLLAEHRAEGEMLGSRPPEGRTADSWGRSNTIPSRE